jgi:DNA-binding MarR family transcriptional regulator
MNLMKSKNPYVRLLNFMRVSNGTDSSFDGCEEIMAYMHEASANGNPVKITDLVQSLQFGTGPTVHRKVVELQKRGLIEVMRSANDGRAKTLVLSDAGIKHLEHRSKSLKVVLQG